MNGWTTMLRAEWDRVTGWLLIIAGATAVVLSFLGVADSPYVSDQLAYIASGGIGGLVLVAVGVGLLIAADLHDEWRKLDRIEAAIRGESLPDTRELVVSAAGVCNGGASFGQARSPSPVSGASFMQLVSLPRGSWSTVAIDWRGDHLRTRLAQAGAGIAAAGFFVAAGWQRAADTSDFNTAVNGAGWAALGLLASTLAIAGYLLWLRGRLGGRKSDLFGDWLLADVAAERRRRRTRREATADGMTASAGGEYLVADGGRRYHRAGCPSLASVSARPVPNAAGTFEPCGICLADD